MSGAARALDPDSISIDLGDALITAWALDGAGGGRALGAGELSAACPAGPLWVHLQRDQPAIRSWLREVAKVPPLIIEALLDEDTRPRCEILSDGLLLNLRGVNLNPGAAPFDMLAVRIWLQDGLLITLRRFRLQAIDDLRQRLSQARGPRSLGDFLVRLADGLTERMAPKAAELEDSLDTMEDDTSLTPPEGLAPLRRSAALLRRFVAPQQLALGRLATAPEPWPEAQDRAALAHAVDAVTRLVEDLDALRERAVILGEQVRQRQAEQTAHATYLLSLVAALFLPLGFVTGLLGINVGGMPGAATSWAFWAVCGALLLLAAFEWWLLKRVGWFAK